MIMRVLAACPFLVLLSCETVPSDDPAGSGYRKSHSLQGVTFTVECPNEGSLNPLTITPQGLAGDNSPVRVEADGTVTGSEVADLNGDGSPEIYVFVTSAGSGSYGSLVAYGANNKKSLSAISLPELGPGTPGAEGYQGHDEFAVVENRLARRFPVYREGDSNATPTGGTRQLNYRLVAGEAGWLLRLDNVSGS